MLKYIIAFCIISFCHSLPSFVGDYDELVFSQRTPAAAHCYLHSKVRYETMTASDVIAYLSQYWMVFDPIKWIINDLRSIEFGGGLLINCQDKTGRKLRYFDAVPPDSFREQLKKKWPAFCSILTEFDLWGSHYDTYGSCIKPTPLEYFEFSMSLLEEYNVGRILERSRILPGHTYSIHQIMVSLKDALQVRPYVKCLPSRNPRSQNQYLYEVQICFDKEHQLKDCDCPVVNLCNSNKTVIYAGS